MATNEMMSNGQQTNICVQCGKEVEVFNRDLAFSMELHMQSHKSLEAVTASLNQPYDLTQANTSLKTLDNIFQSASASVRSHKGFILINENFKVACSVCGVVCDDYSLLIPHLKSLNHETHVNAYLKKLIPSKKLQENLNFISFQVSNLSCSLCESNIKMNSSNMFETVVNIFLHNSLPEHLGRMSFGENQNEENKDIYNVRSSSRKIFSNENKSFGALQADKIDSDQTVHSNLTVQLANMSIDPCDSAKSSEIGPKRVVTLSVLLSSLPENLQHVKKYFSQNEEGVVFCDVCACKVPPSLSNIESHLKGNVHKKTFIKSLLSGFSDIQNEMCVTVNDDLFPFCSTCNCKLSPDNLTIAQHLKGSRHMKNTFCAVIPEELHHLADSLYVTEQNQVMCKVCNTKVKPASIKQHLKLQTHKDKFVDPLVKSLPASNTNLPFSITDLSRIQCSICKMTFGVGISELVNHHKKTHAGLKKPKEGNVSAVMSDNGNSSSILPTNEKKAEATCLVCQVKLSPSAENILEHVRGSRHTELVKRLSVTKPEETKK